MTELTHPTSDVARPQALAPGKARFYALAGVGFGLLFPIAATALSLSQSAAGISLENALAVQRTQPLLWLIDTAPVFLAWFAGAAGRREDFLEKRGAQLTDHERELTSIKADLETQVTERSRELEQANVQIQAAVRMSRQLSEIHDPAALARAAVELVTHEFKNHNADFYYVDENATAATLAASSSEAKAQLVSGGHYIRAGDGSLVGEVAARGKVLESVPPQNAEGGANAAGQTWSIALPVIARGRTLGVLDIYTTQRAGMHAARSEYVQMLIDQLGIAIENARLAEQTEKRLGQLRESAGRAGLSGAQDYWQQHRLVFQYTPGGIREADEAIKPDAPQTLHVPLVIRGQQVGAIALKRSPTEPWSDADRDLAEKAGTQVALALENLRLLQDTQQRALYEQRLSEISARLSSSVDIDTLLQTAVREIAGLPEVSDASVFLAPAAPAAEPRPK
jgi:GAF domain-containing protein